MLVDDCYICGVQYQYGELQTLEIYNYCEYEPDYSIKICPECGECIKRSINIMKNERGNNERSDR